MPLLLADCHPKDVVHVSDEAAGADRLRATLMMLEVERIEEDGM